MKNVTIRSFEVKSGPYDTAEDAITRIKMSTFPQYHDIAFQPKEGWYVISEYVKTYELEVSENRVACKRCSGNFDYDEHETVCPYCGFDHKNML